MQTSKRYCPYCGSRLRSQARRCDRCGQSLESHLPDRLPTGPGSFWGSEYRSEQTVLGLPLIHIARGIHPETGMPRVAKGFIAVGGFAIGVIAVGGFAAGVVVFSGIGLGLVAIGGIAMGGFALGGTALGIFMAVGGLAISMGYAFGALPIAPPTPWAMTLLADLREALERIFQ